MIYKLVVISDTHHDINKLRRIIPIINSSDYLIFCGDGLGDVISMRYDINVPMICVKGNNDYEMNMADMASVILGETRVLVTHGHRQDVRKGLSSLAAFARMRACGLVFFGHTHSFFDRIVDGVHFVNPGALCLGSYALVLGDGRNFSVKREIIESVYF